MKRFLHPPIPRACSWSSGDLTKCSRVRDRLSEPKQHEDPRLKSSNTSNQCVIGTERRAGLQSDIGLNCPYDLAAS